MCLNPIVRLNNSYCPPAGFNTPAGWRYTSKGEIKKFNSIHIQPDKFINKLSSNIYDKYILVPCGHCLECMQKRQHSYRQKITLECSESIAYFFTLTYNNEGLPSINTSNNTKLIYADSSDIQNMFKRIRKDNLFKYPFKYIYVNEFGTDKHRPHWHGILFFNKKEFTFGTGVLNKSKMYSQEKLIQHVMLEQWCRITRIGSHSYERKQLLTPKRIWKNGRWTGTYDISLAKSPESVMNYICKYLFTTSTIGVNTDRMESYIEPVDNNIHDKQKENYSFHLKSKNSKTAIYLSKLYSLVKNNTNPDEVLKLRNKKGNIIKEQSEFSYIWNKVKPRVRSSVNIGFGWYDDNYKTSNNYKVLYDLVFKSAELGDKYPEVLLPGTTKKCYLSSQLYKKIRDIDLITTFYMNNYNSQRDDLFFEEKEFDGSYQSFVERERLRAKIWKYENKLLHLAERNLDSQ